MLFALLVTLSYPDLVSCYRLPHDEWLRRPCIAAGRGLRSVAVHAHLPPVTLQLPLHLPHLLAHLPGGTRQILVCPSSRPPRPLGPGPMGEHQRQVQTQFGRDPTADCSNGSVLYFLNFCFIKIKSLILLMEVDYHVTILEIIHSFIITVFL